MFHIAIDYIFYLYFSILIISVIDL